MEDIPGQTQALKGEHCQEEYDPIASNQKWQIEERIGEGSLARPVVDLGRRMIDY